MKTIKRLIPVVLIFLFIISLFMITTANKKPQPEGFAGQMKEYYQSGTEPQGNIFYHFDISSASLPETDEKGTSKLIKLPLYRQGHNFTCGVSCAASVLRWAGYDFDAREDRLLLELQATPADGTGYMNIARYLSSVRMEDFPDTPVISADTVCVDYSADEYGLGTANSLLAQFRAALDDNSPIICAIQAWKDGGDYSTAAEDDGHYVVLIGYKKDDEKDTYIYYFMDPSTSGSYTYLTEEEFILRWHDNLNGRSKRIGIVVSYLNAKQEIPADIAYHID